MKKTARKLIVKDAVEIKNAQQVLGGNTLSSPSVGVCTVCGMNGHD